MKKNLLEVAGSRIPLYTVAVAVVGSGAAGYNAADSLFELGVTDVCIVTEGKNMGTSRNTGSDKQTYYKLNMAGDIPDSVTAMARTLMRGGSMHGDLALTDAALSARCFYKLVGLGVPFPINEYGEYVGYRTDHDETTRATSCGPYTSRLMTEALERAVGAKGIPVLGGYRVIRILTENGEAHGLLTLNRALISAENPAGLAVFLTNDIVYAVGGPSAIYADSVYPESQTTALGVAFSAGAAGANLTESQYGLASVKFRWNLSGTYQQVLPRYVSTDKDGLDEREFLADVFGSPTEMLAAVFAKGYEWPFDPAKTGQGGSSRIDLAVFRERARGRRVFLDYRRNPTALPPDFSSLGEKAREYLCKSEALFGTPIERLKKMNPAAAELFFSHGIPLEKEMLEISVSAQHCNGGLAVLCSRESPTLRHFYPVGECAGTFGVYRPGGTALNATQTDSLFASMHLASVGTAAPVGLSPDITAQIHGEVDRLQAIASGKNTKKLSRDDLLEKRHAAAVRMSACAAFLRNGAAVSAAFETCRTELAFLSRGEFSVEAPDLTELAIDCDVLTTQFVMLGAIRDYLADGGESRGSYLVTNGDVSGALSAVATLDSAHAAFVQNTLLHPDGTVSSVFEPARPIPAAEHWFEKVWNRTK